MANAKKSRDFVADYYDVFNEEVKQFLDPFAGNDYELEGSRIHMDSKVCWFEDHERADEPVSSSEVESESADSEDSDDDEERYETAEEYQEESVEKSDGATVSLGTFWSVSEKIIFFHCLSRYSIHCLDEWRDRLPHKSKFEILVYYRVLKENLDHLKRFGNKLSGILSRADLPIAYEMDEFYVELEERISGKVRLEYEKPAPDSHTGDESSLLALDNWNKRWLPIYSKTRVEELTPACFQPLPFSQDAINLLTRRCIDYTRRLVTTVILSEIEKICVPVAMFQEQDHQSAAHHEDQTLVISHSKKGFPHVITKESIVNAVYALRQEGFEAPTLAETVVRTIQKFELKHEENGKLFKNRFVTRSLMPSLLESLGSPTALPTSSSEPTEKRQDVALINKLYKLNGGKPPSKKRRIAELQDGFIQDDELHRMDNPLELQLCDWETQMMDAADQRQSRRHQHIMMAYLAGDTTALTIEPPTTTREATTCPIPAIPATMINRFLHSNT